MSFVVNLHSAHLKASVDISMLPLPMQALTVITWLQRVAYAAVAVASLVAAAAVGAGRSPVACAAVGAGALAAAVVAWRLGQVQQKFMFVDYVQADH